MILTVAAEVKKFKRKYIYLFNTNLMRQGYS